MSCRRFRDLVCLVVVLAWIAPTTFALAVEIHLDGHHHDGHSHHHGEESAPPTFEPEGPEIDGEHSHELAESLGAIATPSVRPALPLPTAGIGHWAISAQPDHSALADAVPPDRPSPPPLFCRHCALLC